jgi:hypothetical protein
MGTQLRTRREKLQAKTKKSLLRFCAEEMWRDLAEWKIFVLRNPLWRRCLLRRVSQFIGGDVLPKAARGPMRSDSQIDITDRDGSTPDDHVLQTADIRSQHRAQLIHCR